MSDSDMCPGCVQSLAAKAEADRLKMLGDALDDQVVIGQLGTVSEATPWWRCVHALLGGAARNETAAALAPNLSADARHYNAGRAAAIADFQSALIQLWQRSQRRQ